MADSFKTIKPAKTGKTENYESVAPVQVYCLNRHDLKGLSG